MITFVVTCYLTVVGAALALAFTALWIREVKRPGDDHDDLRMVYGMIALILAVLTSYGVEQVVGQARALDQAGRSAKP